MPQNPQLFIYFQCSYLANYILKNFQKLLDFYIVSSFKKILYLNYPLTAPIFNPPIICFWKSTNTIVGGIVAITRSSI